MRRGCFGIAALVFGSTIGCQSKKYDVSVPVVEEYRVAPDEARFNTPPEQGYRKPPPKKEFKPGVMPGGPGGPGGGPPMM